MSGINSVQVSPEAELATKAIEPKKQESNPVETRQRPAPEQSTKRDEKVSNNEVTATYQEAEQVADKLQARINELSSDPHQVSIHNDEETKQYVIEIKDPEGKTVKQFPPEKVLNLHQKLDDLSGMVIDEMI
ncbi:MAG: flagellar protein FlaG [bacterium]|nr:flagellar protein FlaG [bacterium]